ncbi:MAG TPA: phosphonoacetaldehyde hydrolase, partial [Dongiaceae bacterium]|nr:phosphonoacetaldehyde hydrolase [Dongiaceae bacterium]
MTFTYQRSYRGKLQAAIFDWAGTVLDFGCLAPAITFIEGFRREGVDITVGEAREPMGAHKRVHIEKITQMEPVRQRWIAKHGKPPTDADVERMYQA